MLGSHADVLLFSLVGETSVSVFEGVFSLVGGTSESTFEGVFSLGSTTVPSLIFVFVMS
ncbi:hypothetical protein [Bacillus paramycoides]|uniref:hypothetical protein n=1 Tax=Bacillus paramycoides TaxID=2026194 RepID=UPI00211D4DAD|nr:hypothetical protein [Bacillus paramycoides]